MKKLLTVVALLASTAGFAQLEKGSILVTGFGSINSTTGENVDAAGTKTDAPSTFGGTLGLGGGYLIQDNLSVGAFIALTGTTTKNDVNNTENSANNFGFGIGARKYTKCADNLYVFGQLGFGLLSGKTEFKNNGTLINEGKTNTFTLGLAPGISYFLSNCVAFDMTVGNLGYTSTKTEDVTNNTENTTNNFGLNLNLTTVTFGVQVFFNSGGNGGE